MNNEGNMTSSKETNKTPRTGPKEMQVWEKIQNNSSS